MSSDSRALLALLGVATLASCNRPDSQGNAAPAASAAGSEATKAADSAAPLPGTSYEVEAFRDWAAKARKDPRAVEGEEDCNGPSDPSPTICAKNYQPSELEAYTLNYDRSESKAFLFSGLFHHVLAQCSALGASTTLREWRDGKSRKKLCEYTGGPLSGLRAVVEQQTDSSYIFLFSPEYLDRDRKFREVVEQEGRQ